MPPSLTLPDLERRLTEQWGGPVKLHEAQALQERGHVFRYLVESAPTGAPASLIVKHYRAFENETYDPRDTDGFGPAARLFNDWAGLQFLADTHLVPQFYLGDVAAGFFVMEDFGERRDPAQDLLGDDPRAAEQALVRLAARLGQMHASTIGRAAEYQQVRDALGPPAALTHTARYAQIASGFTDMLNAVGIAPAPGLTAELGRLRVALTEPGPFWAYTHGDPCPDNWMWVDDELYLFDFEGGRYRHALMEGVYGRIHFPTCWCVNRLPDDMPLKMENAYRAELITGCPAATDDTLFNRAVVEGCAFWMQAAARPIMGALEEDREWGIATVRQRILFRADIFARLTQERGEYEAFGATMAHVAAHLRTRWPAEADALPLYPAFRAHE